MTYSVTLTEGARADLVSIFSPAIPVARDEMDGGAFRAMMERGLKEAKADNSRPASDVFADLRREIG